MKRILLVLLLSISMIHANMDIIGYNNNSNVIELFNPVDSAGCTCSYDFTTWYKPDKLAYAWWNGGNGQLNLESADQGYYHTLPINTDFAFEDGSDFSFGSWVYKTGNSGCINQPIMVYVDWATAKRWRTFVYTTSGKCLARANTNNGSLNLAHDSISIINDSTWHFIFVTVNRSGYERLYFDGIEESNQSTQGISGLNFSDSLYVGGDDNPTTVFFNGSIDEVFVFSDALTSSEVYDLYSMGRDRGYDYVDAFPGRIVSHYGFDTKKGIDTLGENHLQERNLTRLGIDGTSSLEVRADLRVLGYNLRGASRYFGRPVTCDSDSQYSDTGTECCLMYEMSCLTTQRFSTSSEYTCSTDHGTSEEFFAYCY